MKIKNVIGECLVRAGKDDFVDNPSLTDEQKELQNRLLACVNIAYREIVSKYLPLIYEEQVVFKTASALQNPCPRRLSSPCASRWATR